MLLLSLLWGKGGWGEVQLLPQQPFCYRQMNEELGHKLRTQIKQIAQLTGERE